MWIKGDTKAGTFIAKDRYGNKYYENLAEELPCQFVQSLYHDAQLTVLRSEDTMGGL